MIYLLIYLFIYLFICSVSYKAENFFLSSVVGLQNSISSHLILLCSVYILTWELLWAVWQHSKTQSPAAEQLSPYRAGLWQNKSSHEWRWTQSSAEQFNLGEWRRRLQHQFSCVYSPAWHLPVKMKLTACKIPTPAVVFGVNHPQSLFPSLLTTLHFSSFILCWTSGGGLWCVVEGLGMTVAFSSEQLPRLLWIRPSGSFIFYLQKMWREH